MVLKHLEKNGNINIILKNKFVKFKWINPY